MDANISLSMPRETAERLVEVSASGATAQLVGQVRIPETVTLADQDRIILSLLADDLSIAQISDKLGRAESTIQLRLRYLKNKFGCRGLAGLVAAAMRKKVID